MPHRLLAYGAVHFCHLRAFLHILITDAKISEYLPAAYASSGVVKKGKKMREKEKALCELLPGEVGVVSSISADTGMLRRFMDIGCMVGEHVQMLGRGPFGDPCAYRICGAVIAIRGRDAAHIHVSEHI